jgi:hypothetical protein
MSNQSPTPSGAVSATPPQTRPANIFNPKIDGSDYYFVTVNSGSLANGAQSSVTVQMDNQTDFYWFATTYMADLAGAPVTDSTLIVPLVTLLVYDGGSTRQLMDSAVPINSLASPTGKEPYRLIRPRIFVASASVKFTFANYSAGTTYSNIYLSLHGYRRWAGT